MAFKITVLCFLRNNIYFVFFVIMSLLYGSPVNGSTPPMDRTHISTNLNDNSGVDSSTDVENFSQDAATITGYLENVTLDHGNSSSEISVNNTSASTVKPLKCKFVFLQRICIAECTPINCRIVFLPPPDQNRTSQGLDKASQGPYPQSNNSINASTENPSVLYHRVYGVTKYGKMTVPTSHTTIVGPPKLIACSFVFLKRLCVRRCAAFNCRIVFLPSNENSYTVTIKNALDIEDYTRKPTTADPKEKDTFKPILSRAELKEHYSDQYEDYYNPNPDSEEYNYDRDGEEDGISGSGDNYSEEYENTPNKPSGGLFGYFDNLFFTTQPHLADEHVEYSGSDIYPDSMGESIVSVDTVTPAIDTEFYFETVYVYSKNHTKVNTVTDSGDDILQSLDDAKETQVAPNVDSSVYSNSCKLHIQLTLLYSLLLLAFIM